MTVLLHEEVMCSKPICDDKNTAPDRSLRQLEIENRRLRTVIAQLLIKNQKLRWEMRER